MSNHFKVIVNTKIIKMEGITPKQVENEIIIMIIVINKTDESKRRQEMKNTKV